MTGWRDAFLMAAVRTRTLLLAGGTFGANIIANPATLSGKQFNYSPLKVSGVSTTGYCYNPISEPTFLSQTADASMQYLFLRPHDWRNGTSTNHNFLGSSSDGGTRAFHLPGFRYRNSRESG